MKLIRFIIKDKISNIGADIRELFDCTKDCLRTTRSFNKTSYELYINMIKLRYYSFKLKHSKENIINYYDIISDNSYIWNITDYFEEYTKDEDMSYALYASLGKNNNTTYKIYYTMNVGEDDTVYCNEIKGHSNMIIWCYTYESEDRISVSNIEI